MAPWLERRETESVSSGIGHTWAYKLLDLGALCSLPMIQGSPEMYWNLLDWLPRADG